MTARHLATPARTPDRYQRPGSSSTLFFTPAVEGSTLKITDHAPTDGAGHYCFKCSRLVWDHSLATSKQVVVALDFSATNALRYALIQWIETAKIQRVQFVDEQHVPQDVDATAMPDLVQARARVSLDAYRSGVATGEDPGTPFELARRRIVGLVTGPTFKYKFGIAFGGGIWATYDKLPRDRQRDLVVYLSMAAMTELGLWRDTEADRNAIEDRELAELESQMSPETRAAMKAALAKYQPG